MAVLAVLAYVVPLAADPSLTVSAGTAALLYVGPAIVLAVAFGAAGAAAGALASVALLARHVDAYGDPGALGDAGSQIAFVAVGAVLGAWIHRLLTARARMQATIDRLRAAQRERDARMAEGASRGTIDEEWSPRDRRDLDIALQRLVAGSETALSSVAVVVIEVRGLATLRDQRDAAGVERLLSSLLGDWRRYLRPQDVLLGIGDDRFALLLPACSEANASRVARRLVGDASDVVACAAGAASWDGVEAPDALLARAIATIGLVKDPGEAMGVPG